MKESYTKNEERHIIYEHDEPVKLLITFYQIKGETVVFRTSFSYQDQGYWLESVVFTLCMLCGQTLIARLFSHFPY